MLCHLEAYQKAKEGNNERSTKKRDSKPFEPSLFLCKTQIIFPFAQVLPVYTILSG